MEGASCSCTRSGRSRHGRPTHPAAMHAQPRVLGAYGARCGVTALTFVGLGDATTWGGHQSCISRSNSSPAVGFAMFFISVRVCIILKAWVPSGQMAAALCKHRRQYWLLDANKTRSNIQYCTRPGDATRPACCSGRPHATLAFDRDISAARALCVLLLLQLVEGHVRVPSRL